MSYVSPLCARDGTVGTTLPSTCWMCIAATSRQIDDVPTRTELIQYERRFVELYEQVASKLDETRKYFNTYNTLDDTHKFLQKEVALLNSINEGFAKSMTSRAGKENFLGQFDNIIKGVRAAAEKEKNTLQEKKMIADNLDSKYQVQRPCYFIYATFC